MPYTTYAHLFCFCNLHWDFLENCFLRFVSYETDSMPAPDQATRQARITSNVRCENIYIYQIKALFNTFRVTPY